MQKKQKVSSGEKLLQRYVKAAAPERFIFS